MAAAPAPESLPEFYKRELLPPCVDYCSAEGKARLIRALVNGDGEMFLPLSAQFRTQDDPAFCGLSTLVMSLNALQVDPQRRWKGSSVWRWYDEDMLSCCEPVDSVRKKGISLDSLACLARCQGVVADVYRPPVPGGKHVGWTEGAFRDMLLKSVRSSNLVMVVSFSRTALNQTGGGHFSPIAAFDAETDSVLVMDVARFKLPPFWVPVSDLYGSTVPPDPDTGLPRGWMMIKRLAAAPFVMITIEDALGLDGASRPCSVPSSDASAGLAMRCVAPRLTEAASLLLRRTRAAIEGAGSALDSAELTRLFSSVYLDHIRSRPGKGPSGFTKTCVKRLSGPQLADARLLARAIEAWELFPVVHDAVKPSASPCGSSCSTTPTAAGPCVDIDQSHCIALLMLSIRFALLKEDACPSRRAGILPHCLCSPSLEPFRSLPGPVEALGEAGAALLHNEIAVLGQQLAALCTEEAPLCPSEL
jgi:glutathione gamma-glutamylcysteinyltransferase